MLFCRFLVLIHEILWFLQAKNIDVYPVHVLSKSTIYNSTRTVLRQKRFLCKFVCKKVKQNLCSGICFFILASFSFICNIFLLKRQPHEISPPCFFINQFILVPLEMSMGSFFFASPVLWKPGSRNYPVLWTLGSRDSPVSKGPGSCNSPVPWKPASRFTVCVNLQAHAIAFKATLIHKTV